MAETTQFGNNEDLGGNDGALKANTILMARYKVLGQLGGGGQGAVYQARDLNFPDAKRLVAIKEMHYASGDPSMRAQSLAAFQREANILATLSHSAIPKIFDFFDQNNRAYLVMEFINGSDLELLLTKTKELPMDKILEWAVDLCDVLDYLHKTEPEPIIFRDVKPANIMIDKLGKVRLIDFGIAKIFVSGVKNTMIGTEGYSAPEQYKGDVNLLSDIYSLGATLHHIITRKDPRLEPPFSFNERPLVNFNPKIPYGLQEVLDKALSMNPAERYQSCAEMKEAFLSVQYRNTNPSIGNISGTRAMNEPGTSFFAGSEFDANGVRGKIEPRWTFKSEDEIRANPTALNKVAYFGSYDTNVWAINLDDGSFRWKYATSGGIASAPYVDSNTGMVFFGSEDNNFYSVNALTGKIAWSHLTGGRVRGAPTVAHDSVFFGSDDGRLYALAASNGRPLWEYDMGAPIRLKPYVTEDLIIIGSESGELIGLELSGNRKWNYRLRRAVTSSPSVDVMEGVGYVGSVDGYLYAIDISNGYSMWRFRTGGPIISSVAIDGSTLFFGSADCNFYAINAENAKEKWRFTSLKPIVGSPVVHNGFVYFGGTDGVFYCLEAKSGKEVWKFETGNSITAQPFISDKMILVASMDHVLYALPLV
ncbi:MAG: serine/threonine-protein kinase [Phototrophicales bacterium]|nr:serine/threonine-protein kinase [Phototrophicales bacterium]